MKKKFLMEFNRKELNSLSYKYVLSPIAINNRGWPGKTYHHFSKTFLLNLPLNLDEKDSSELSETHSRWNYGTVNSRDRKEKGLSRCRCNYTPCPPRRLYYKDTPLTDFFESIAAPARKSLQLFFIEIYKKF